MTDALVVVALGFFLGMRHATDADHVIAVTTIVSRQRDLVGAALTGLLWGTGHSLTVIAVGTAIIVSKVTIPDRLGMGMELSVGAMLVVLGLLNITTFRSFRPSIWQRLARSSAGVHSHAHSHGDYVHTHPHGHLPDVHPHRADQTPVASLDRRFGQWSLYQCVRPVAVGVVHGLAGSAALTLLIVATVSEQRWAIAYLLVFGIGTVAGMMLVTVSIASAVRFAGDRSEAMSRHFGFASGLVAVVFGLAFAYDVWSSAGSPGQQPF